MFVRFTAAQKIVLVFSVIVLVAGLVVGHRPDRDGGGAESQSQVEYTLADAASVPVTVHVVGAVQRPGLYTVAAGARVRDAIVAAGGLRADADSASVNLAAFVDDGEQISVDAMPTPEPEPQPESRPTAPVPSAAPPAASPAPASPSRPQRATRPAGRSYTARAPSAPSAAAPSDALPEFMRTPAQVRVPLNRAGLDELQSIPGIGPELARNIIYYRSAHGPFRRFSDLDAVPGIGPATVEKIRVSATLN